MPITSIILVFGFFLSFFLWILVLTKRDKSVSDKILSFYFLVSALVILFAFFEIYNRKNGYPFPSVIGTSTPFILLVGPLLWLYIESLTNQTFRLKGTHLLHATPFVSLVILLFVRMFLLPDSVKIEMDQSEAFKKDFIFPLVVTMIALSNVGYTVWGLFLIKSYRKRIKTYFSDIDELDLSWLRFLLLSALIFLASISLLYIVDSMLKLMTYELLQVIGFSIASVFVMVLGFFGLRQGSRFSVQTIRFDMDKAASIPIQDANLKKDEEDFVHKLLSHMKEQKPYINPDITIAKLSDELGVTPEYLSGILNGRLSMNFFDFINHHRIEEFKELCKNPKNQNFTLISLAYDCGFNSKATFNRVFKKNVGVTPSEYFQGVSKKLRPQVFPFLES